MSQYIANLNTSAPVAPEDDQNEFSFATADFFDFDMAAPVGFSQEQDGQGQKDDVIGQWATQPAGSDLLDADFNFADLPGLPSILSTNANDISPVSPTSTYNLLQQKQTHALPLQSPITPTAPYSKRKLSDFQDPSLSMEERTRVAAEEDKRRRNTAASARFRVKKKQREQTLEKTAKEMTDKAGVLEKRVQELEMENRWLKGLITETNGAESIRERYARFIAENTDKKEKKEKPPKAKKSETTDSS